MSTAGGSQNGSLNLFLGTIDWTNAPEVMDSMSGNISTNFTGSAACVKVGNALKVWELAYPLFEANPGWMNFDLIVYTIFTSLIALVGFAANILFATILWRSKRFSSVAPYLICLAICDNLLLIFHYFGFDFLFGLKHLVDGQYICGTYEPYYEAYGKNVTCAIIQACGVLTAALTITRFVSIYKPMRSKVWLTSRFNRNLALILTIAPFIVNVVPIYFNDIAGCFDENGQYQWTISVSRPNVSISLNFWIRFAFTVIPQFLCVYIGWCVIAIFNVLLIFQVRKATKMRKQMRSSSRDTNIRLAISLICITMSYCILMVPTSAHVLLMMIGVVTEYPTLCTRPYLPGTLRMIYAFRFCHTFNSCINFVWFMMFGSGFRKEASALLCSQKEAESESTNKIAIRLSIAEHSSRIRYDGTSVTPDNQNKLIF